jgi:hypothetical protein
VFIGTGSGAKILGIGNGGATNVNIANGAFASDVQIGNVTGTSSITEKVGTGNYSLDGVGASTYSIGASTVAGTITIGGTAGTGAMIFGSSSATQNVRIGDGAGAVNLFLGNNTNNGSNASIFNGTGANTINMLNGANIAAQSFNLLSGGSSGGNTTVSIQNGTNNNLATFNLQTDNGGGNKTINLLTGATGSTAAFNLGTGTATAGTKIISIGSTDVFTQTKLIGQVDYSTVAISATGSVAFGTNYEICTGTITRTLPTAASSPGRKITIKNAGTGTVTAAISGGASFDPNTSFPLATFPVTTAVSQDFISDGTIWSLI